MGANPPRGWTRGSTRMSERVLELAYVHIADGPRSRPYKHDFESGGVCMEGLPDGSVRLFHPELRIWEEFP